MRNKPDLYYDNGKLRRCSHNIFYISHLRYIWEFEIKQATVFADILYGIQEALSGLWTIFQVTLFILLFPFMLIARSIYQKKRAKHDMELFGKIEDDEKTL